MKIAFILPRVTTSILEDGTVTSNQTRGYAGGVCKRRFHSENASNISVHTTPDEYKNVKITGHHGFVCEKTGALKSHDYRFDKAPFTKCCPCTLKRKAVPPV